MAAEITPDFVWNKHHVEGDTVGAVCLALGHVSPYVTEYRETDVYPELDPDSLKLAQMGAVLSRTLAASTLSGEVAGTHLINACVLHDLAAPYHRVEAVADARRQQWDDISPSWTSEWLRHGVRLLLTLGYANNSYARHRPEAVTRFLGEMKQIDGPTTSSRAQLILAIEHGTIDEARSAISEYMTQFGPDTGRDRAGNHTVLATMAARETGLARFDRAWGLRRELKRLVLDGHITDKQHERAYLRSYAIPQVDHMLMGVRGKLWRADADFPQAELDMAADTFIHNLGYTGRPARPRSL